MLYFVLFTCLILNIRVNQLSIQTLTERDFQLVIPYGQPKRLIAASFIKQGILTNELDFFIVDWLLAGKNVLKAGTYTFNSPYSIVQIFQRLYAGKVDQYQIAIPEGLTKRQILNLLQENLYLSGYVTTEYFNNLQEGALLPETYYFPLLYDRQQLLLRMEQAMQQFLETNWRKGSVDKSIIKTAQEALILASIIEKETGLDEERARVSAVFINRLRIKMRLQSDATVLYGITLGEYELVRSLKREDLRRDTPYNTYTNFGLPPTPIANPGKASILAALNPIQSKELFFVANGRGGHFFAETLEQHNRNIQEWLKIIRPNHTQQ